MTIEWKLKLFYIEELKEWEHNPRILSKHDYKHLKISLEKFGLIDKPILNHDLTLIGGHQRIKILKDNGLKKIECWYPSRELSQEEFKELNIRLNKNTGEFDFDILSSIFDEKELIDFGFSEKDFSVDSDIDPDIIDNISLPDGEKEFCIMNFYLTNEQNEIVEQALKVAKSLGEFEETGNENSNGNALARICEMFRPND